MVTDDCDDAAEDDDDEGDDKGADVPMRPMTAGEEVVMMSAEEFAALLATMVGMALAVLRRCGSAAAAATVAVAMFCVMISNGGITVGFARRNVLALRACFETERKRTETPEGERKKQKL